MMGAPRSCAISRNRLSTTGVWRAITHDGSIDDTVLDRAAELSAEVIAGAEAQRRLREVLASS